MGPIFFPEHTGLPFNMDTSQQEYYMMQLHYDNPDLIPNLTLRYSLELFYTEKLRPNDLGLMMLGATVERVGDAPGIVVPPNTLRHTVSGYCPRGCTRKLFPANGINIVASKHHTHLGNFVKIFQFHRFKTLCLNTISSTYVIYSILPTTLTG